MELPARAPSAAGELRAVWRGRDHGGKSVPPGIYFVKLESGPRVLVLKLVYCR
jgi:hypothetical protein